MGAGAGTPKKKRYAAQDVVDETPGFDHNAWRTPKVKGQVQPISERRDAAASWSPRQGGKSASEAARAQEVKEMKAKMTPMPKVNRPLSSPTAAEGPTLFASSGEIKLGLTHTSISTGEASAPGSVPLQQDYVPALGDGPVAKDPSPGKGAAQEFVLSLPGPAPEEEAVDCTALLEDVDIMWKKLLVKRQGASANMGALFNARRLKDEVEEASKSTIDTQQKKAMAAGKVANKVHAVDDACLALEKKAVKNMGVANVWRRNDLAVRSGGNGLCEIMVPHVKGEIEVRMCVTGATLSVERGSLIPMTRMQMEELRKLLAEVESAKSDQIRLESAVSQCSRDLKQKHQKLIDQIKKELEELDKNPEFAPPGTEAQNMELVIGWNGGQQKKDESQVPNFPQMAGLISAAEMMLKAQNEAKWAAEKASKPKASGGGAAAEAEKAPTCEWVEEKTDEGKVAYRNGRTGEVVEELPDGVTAADVQKAVPDGSSKAPSPTMPLGARPPWQQAKAAAKAPPRPKEGQIWREPGLSWKAKAPPPMPKVPAFLAKEGEEAPAHSASLGPAAAKIPAVPEPEPAEPEPAEPKAPAVATSYWTEVRTDEGDVYYHNEDTDETAWELPPGGVVRKPWEEAPEPAQTVPLQTVPSQPVEPEPQVQQTGPLPGDDVQKHADQAQAFQVTYWYPVTTEDGQTYYCNWETGETAWDVPCGGKVVASEAEMQQLHEPQQQTQQQIPQAGQAGGAWMACQTAEGHIYYYNQTTGESSWEPPPEMAAQASVQGGGAWDGLYAAHAAEEAARVQRQQYEDALRQMQAAEEAARAQRQQWDQLYAQHFAWYQQQQQQQQQSQQAAAGQPPAETAASGMVPPSLNASMEEQIAFAMKCSVVQEMEEMIKSGVSVADRKKALKNWQIKWHPDKNPEQEEVAKTLFQFLADKRSWFLKDPDADVGGWEDLPVESVD